MFKDLRRDNASMPRNSLYKFVLENWGKKWFFFSSKRDVVTNVLAIAPSRNRVDLPQFS